MNTLEKKINEAKSLLNHARLSETRALLSQLLGEKIPRVHYQTVSNLCRRAGLPNLSLRLLNRVVRPPAGRASNATEGELAEYAALLIKIGAREEALGILSQLNSERNPEVLLLKAFALIPNWDYESTISLLSRYIGHPKTSSYQRYVARTNLAAAYISKGSFSEAENLLSDLKTVTMDHSLLQLHIYELLGQMAILSNQWTEASQYLDKAENLLGTAKGTESILIDKWRAILEIRRTHSSRAALQQLRRVKSEAGALKHWETVRDCDLFEAIHTRNFRLLTHVYIGTPFPAFRARIERDYGKPISIPESYAWVPGGQKQAQNIFDPFDPGTIQKHSGGSSTLVKLLSALCTDFYRPLRIGSLHNLVYRNEYFDPFSSPTRLHQLLKRTRTWLRKEKAGIEIQETSGTYGLLSISGAAIRVYHRQLAYEPKDRRLSLLRDKFQGQCFSMHMAASALQMSLSSTIRLVRQGLESKELIKTGSYLEPKYTFRE